MAKKANREREIFLAVLEQESARAQAAFLEKACAGDRDLRRRVEALLRAHGEPDRLLDQPAIALDTRVVGAADQGTLADGLPEGLDPPREAGSLGRLDHYEVQGVIGRGGMGVVLRAHDTQLQRTVALKVLTPKLAANPQARQRILREAQAAAAVCDDHVVALHAVQKDGALPYLVMEFVSGITLDECVRKRGVLDAREILRIGRQIAHGLDVAHGHGLVHRDIKPGNILLEHGSGRVKITDFGLARAGDATRLTNLGEIIGTPQYMSPEQARGDPVDVRSDLFSLGSLLYTLCTAGPPFCSANAMGVLRVVCEDVAPPIRVRNPEIPPALCAVIERLHAKDPAGRFQSAAEVAQVLGELLAALEQGRLDSLPAASVGTTGPSVSLRRLALVLTAVAAIGLPLGYGLHVAGLLRFPDAPPEAASLHEPPASPALDARRHEDLPDYLLALAGVGDAAAAPVEVIAVLDSPHPLHPRLVEDMFYLDRQTLVTADWSGSLAWWDVASGKLRRRLPAVHTRWIRGFALSPDGKRLATGGPEGATATGRVCLWNAHTGELLQTIAFPLHVLSLAFSPDGKWLAVGSGNNPIADSSLSRAFATGFRTTRFAGRVALLDAATGKQVHNITASTHHWIQHLVFSPDSRLLAVAGHDNKVRLFNPETGSEVRSWVVPEATAWIAIAPSRMGPRPNRASGSPHAPATRKPDLWAVR
jgi:serine/threonine protein kinase